MHMIPLQTQDLAAQMSLCKYADPYKWESPCNTVKFSLEQLNRGKLIMSVPSFAPRDHYKLRVAGSSKVRAVTRVVVSFCCCSLALALSRARRGQQQFMRCAACSDLMPLGCCCSRALPSHPRCCCLTTTPV